MPFNFSTASGFNVSFTNAPVSTTTLLVASLAVARSVIPLI